MKIKQQYKVREMAGEHVVIMQGKFGADMTRIISLNESALYLWNAIYDKDENYGKDQHYICRSGPFRGDA